MPEYHESAAEQAAQISGIRAYLGVCLTLLIFLCVYVVFFYAESGVGFPKLTLFTCVLGYFCAFGILITVPIDIATVVIDRHSKLTGRDPIYDTDIDLLASLYSFFFNTILVLCSFVMVFEEYYNTDGYFTTLGKVASSTKRLLIDTVAGLIVGLIILGILLGNKVMPSGAQALTLAAVIVTNAIYETFLMFLLGFGLIEFPKSFWLDSNLDGSLVTAQVKAASDFLLIQDARFNVSKTVSDVYKTKQAVNQYGDIKLNDAIDIMLTECPPEFHETNLGEVAANKQGQVTIDTLAALRLRLNTFRDRYRMSQAKIELSKNLAYHLEDLIEARTRGNIHWSLEGKDGTEWEYKWFLTYKPLLNRCTCIFFSIVSFFSFLGVLCSMKGVAESSSIYYLIVHDSNATTGGIVIFIFLTLGYASYTSTWALFQMNFAGLMELVPDRTTPEALSFNVRMVARLAAPLAFFYLGWFAESGLKTGPWVYNSAATYQQWVNGTTTNSTRMFDQKTHSYRRDGRHLNTSTLITYSGNIEMKSAFSHFYQLQSVPAIRNSFGTLFPSLLIIVFFLTITQAYNRLCILFKAPYFQFGTPIVNPDQLEQGKKQLAREKASTVRTKGRLRFNELISKARGLAGSEPEQSGSRFASLFGIRAKDKSKMPKVSDAVPELREPHGLEGVVERKGVKTGTMLSFGAGWQEMYALVKVPGVLHFFKNEAAAKSGSIEPTLPKPIDLKIPLNFSITASKGGKPEEMEVVIEIVDLMTILKVKSVGDAERWKNGLMEWKKFAVDHDKLFKEHDEELGGSRSAGAGGKVTDADLAAIDVDDMDLEGLGGGEVEKKKGGFSGLFGFGGGNKNKAAVASPSSASSHSPLPQAEPTPEKLEGWLEKKHHIGKLHFGKLNSEWQRVYCKIDVATASLNLFKNQDTSSVPLVCIDLKMVEEGGLAVYEKGGNEDASRFSINMGENEKEYKFRAAGAAEGTKWLRGLNAWREHFLVGS